MNALGTPVPSASFRRVRGAEKMKDVRGQIDLARTLERVHLRKSSPLLTVEKRKSFMRVTKLLFMLLLFTVCLKGQNQTRIALSPRSTLPISLVAQGLDRKCSGMLFTSDISKADYVLEASDTDIRYEFTLQSPSGDVLFHTSTKKPDNAMQEVCKFIGRKK